jgi:hypothetical protein
VLGCRLRIRIARLADDRADLGIGEVAHQVADGIALVHRVGVGEDHYLAARALDGCVQAQRLAAAFAHAQQLDAACGIAGGDLVGAVAGCVRDDHDLQLGRRIVERERVHDLLRDDALLVVSRDHQRNRGLQLSVAHRTRAAEPGNQPQERWIADVNVAHNDDHCPEQNFHWPT